MFLKNCAAPLYFFAVFRYNIGKEGGSRREENSRNRILPQHKHSDTVCYYIRCEKRCQPLLPAPKKLFSEFRSFFYPSSKSDFFRPFFPEEPEYENRQIFKGIENFKTPHRRPRSGGRGKDRRKRQGSQTRLSVENGRRRGNHFSSGTLRFRVLELRETVKKDEAQNLYEVLS